MATLLRSTRLISTLRWTRSAQTVRWSSNGRDSPLIRYHDSNPAREESFRDGEWAANSKSSDTIILPDGRLRDFYRYHLTWRIDKHPFQGALWVRTLNLRDEKLSPSINEDPSKIIDDPEADPDLVTACLEIHIARAVAKSEKKGEQRAEFLRIKAGTRALHWLLTGAVERYDLALGPRFLRALAFCMVAEESHKHLWEWMFIAHTPKYMEGWLYNDQIRWKGILLRQLVDSVTYWADDAIHPLQHGLQLYFRAHDRCNASTDENIPLRPARSWLCKQMFAFDISSVDQKLFSRLISLASRHENPGAFPTLDESRLFLYFPGSPKPDRALETLRSYRNDEERSTTVQNLLSGDGRANKIVFFFTVVATAQTLYDQGRVAESKEVLDIGRHLLPTWFQGKIPRTDCSAGERRFIRRPPTARELELGIQVGEDGMIDASERHNEIENALSKQRVEEQQARLQLMRQLKQRKAAKSGDMVRISSRRRRT